jgi:PhoPQ-activated pathogenicity-related protein
MYRSLLLLSAAVLGGVSLPLAAQNLTMIKAHLESPREDSFASGIGLIRGWVCEATTVEVELDGGERWVAGYGTRRDDTAAVCGDVDNGFGLTFNWNRLGDGTHTLRAFADGLEFAAVTFNVTTLGQEYLRGVSGESTLLDFPLPDASAAVHWSEAEQNFMIVAANGNPPCSNFSNVSAIAAEPLSASTPAHLESPSPGSCESGIGLIRGWVCEATTVEVELDGGERWVAGYGTRRNRLGDGTHTLRAFADGLEFAAVTFNVTTLGQEYLQGAGGSYEVSNFPVSGQRVLLSWQESDQNFVISDSSLSQAVGSTDLDRYVAKPDPNYAFTHYRSERGIGYDTHFLSMTSQQWRKPTEVDRVLWTHDIVIIVPQILHSGSEHRAVLLINGASNGGTAPTEVNQVLAGVAVSLGSVVVEVSQIPNQPLSFADEAGRGRKEDEILAYSMDKYLLTGDPEWPVHVAMTKAAVRAMDTVQTFLATRQRIDDFIVLGGSKRGWTTWLAAAVDPRVAAIVPASIDILNLERQFVHHWEAYGFYAPALRDYVEFNLPCRIQTPAGRALLRIIDPYYYRVRYTMPKLILNSTGDQFFVSDSSQFYYDALPGPKWLRYTPNTDHSQGIDVILAALSWIDDINDGKSSPQYGWIRKPDGSIEVQLDAKPKEVRLWQASNPTARDFRLEAIGPAWTDIKMQSNGNGGYIAYLPPPAQGWTASLLELLFNESNLIQADQVYTTGVTVTPDTLPFQGTSCQGQGG